MNLLPRQLKHELYGMSGEEFVALPFINKIIFKSLTIINIMSLPKIIIFIIMSHFVVSP